MYLRPSKMLYRSVKLLWFVFSITFNSQIVFGDDSSTDSATIETISVQSVTTDLPISTTQPKAAVLNSTSQKPNLILKSTPSPSISIRLAGESLKLNVTASENDLEFTITVNNSPQQKSSEFSSQLSKAKRLLIGFDNEQHFNVDVVGLTFTNDTDGKMTFGNQVQDLAWNKRNGVLLPDAVQSYKWVASGAGKNGSHFFVTFTRSWLTCDKQDMQFLLSPVKIWWLVDNDETAILTKGQKKASNTMDKMFEKQIEDPSATQETSSQGSDIKSTTIGIGGSTVVPYLLTTSRNAFASTIATSTTKTNSTINKNSKSLNTTRDSKPDEVEILKSIQEDNFQGPTNMSLNIFLQNVTWVILKRCEAPNLIFRCNLSDYNSLSSSNSSFLPHVWKVILLDSSNSSEKYPEHQLQSCRSALLVGNIGNTKLFNALSGNRNQKGRAPSRNSGYTNHNFRNIELIMKGLLLSTLKTFMK